MSLIRSLTQTQARKRSISSRFLQSLSISLMISAFSSLAQAGNEVCDLSPDVEESSLSEAEFRNSPLRLESRVEKTKTIGKYAFRYCVANDHAFTPVYVLWIDANSDQPYFDGLVAPQGIRYRYSQWRLRYDSGAKLLRYGPSRNRLHHKLEVETIYKKAFSAPNAHVSLSIPAQFTIQNGDVDLDALVDDEKLFRDFLSAGGEVSYLSEALVDLPASTEIAFYLDLGEDVQHWYGDTDFLTVKLSFLSKVKQRDFRPGDSRPEVSNVAMYNVADDERTDLSKLDLSGLFVNVRFHGDTFDFISEDQPRTRFRGISLFSKTPKPTRIWFSSTMLLNSYKLRQKRAHVTLETSQYGDFGGFTFSYFTDAP